MDALTDLSALGLPRGAAPIRAISPGRSRRRAGSIVSACIDLALADALVRLRAPFSVTQVRRLAPLLAIAVALLWAASALFLAVAVPAGSPERALAVLSLDVALVAYSGLGQLAAEILTQRRFSYSESPNREVLRALDLPPLTTFVASEALPRLFGAIVVTGVQGVVALRIAPALGAGLAPAVLVAVPLTVGAARLALAADVATRATVFSLPRWSALVSVGVGVLGGLGAAAIAEGLAGRSAPVAVDAVRGGMVLAFAGLLAAGCALLAAVVGPRAVRRLRHSGLDLRCAAVRRDRRAGIAGIVRGELAGTWAGTTVAAVLLATAALASGALTAARLSEQIRLDVSSPVTRTALVVGVATVCLGIEDSLLRVAGLGRFARQWHWYWSLGANAWCTAGRLLMVLLAPYALVTALLGVACSALTGNVELWVLPAGLSFGAAAVLNDALLPPIQGSDGTTVTNPLSTLATMILAAPTLTVLLVAPLQASWVAFLLLAIALLLIGCAVCAIQNRCRVLSSASLR